LGLPEESLAEVTVCAPGSKKNIFILPLAAPCRCNLLHEKVTRYFRPATSGLWTDSVAMLGSCYRHRRFQRVNVGPSGTARERQECLIDVESGATIDPSTDPLLEVLALTICALSASEFWCETMRPLAEKIAGEMLKRFEIIPKTNPD
jgi:hypothetical protein